MTDKERAARLAADLRSVNSVQAPYANDTVKAWCHEAADLLERLAGAGEAAETWSGWPVPSGWRLVPELPDEGMVRASLGALKRLIDGVPEAERRHRFWPLTSHGWTVRNKEKHFVRLRDAIAAAPPPPPRDGTE